MLWWIGTDTAPVQGSMECLSLNELVPGSPNLGSEQKESIREILCDMITATLSEDEARGSG